jgi:RNA polymerase sigma-70 factor, ECF subfamily
MEAFQPDPLLTGLAAGDEQAFAVLSERFGTRLFRVAMGLLGRREDAEDAVQDVFSAVVRSRGRLADVDDLAAYLFSALRHAAARCAKQRQRQVLMRELVRRMLRRSEAVSDGASRNESREQLQRAMEMLPPEQREVVAYRLAGELTFAQIGRSLGVSEQTAASRYRYALEKLRSLMKESE